jgi:hypothetical protein
MVAFSFIEAIAGPSCMANIAVSSAKGVVVVLCDIRRWLMGYTAGPKTLPCGTPLLCFLQVVISSLNFTRKNNSIKNNCNIL